MCGEEHHGVEGRGGGEGRGRAAVHVIDQFTERTVAEHEQLVVGRNVGLLLNQPLQLLVPGGDGYSYF